MVKDNVELALILVVAVSLMPIVFEWLKHRIDTRREMRALRAAESE